MRLVLNLDIDRGHRHDVGAYVIAPTPSFNPARGGVSGEAACLSEDESKSSEPSEQDDHLGGRSTRGADGYGRGGSTLVVRELGPGCESTAREDPPLPQRLRRERRLVA